MGFAGGKLAVERKEKRTQREGTRGCSQLEVWEKKLQQPAQPAMDFAVVGSTHFGGASDLKRDIHKFKHEGED